MTSTASSTGAARRMRRGTLLTITSASLAAALTASVALADVPNTFASGQVLKAVDLNANFTDLDERLLTLESAEAKQTAAGQYSIGAVYCGATDPTTGDLSGLAAPGTGYVRAKGECQEVCGSPSAHLCDGSELVRSAQLGTTFDGPGWYSAGAYSSFAGQGNYECFGWTTSDSSTLGALWNIWNGVPFPSADACHLTYPALCCD